MLWFQLFAIVKQAFLGIAELAKGLWIADANFFDREPMHVEQRME
jgi:hypothetical protein